MPRPAFLLAACLLLVIVGSPLVAAQPGEKVLSIRPHRQNTLVWCWGASAAMVIEYITGRRIEDCEVLSAYDRYAGGRGTCCTGDPRCVRGAMPGEIETILGEVYSIHGRSQTIPVSFQEIVASIDDGKPMIIWLWRTATSAHVVVVAGYRLPNTVVVLDPMTGRQDVPYPTLRGNWLSGVWRDTILISTAQQTGPRSDPPPRPQTMSRSCRTPVGSCAMKVPLAPGSHCECRWPTGTVPGQAR